MKVAILGPLDLQYMGGGETNSMMMANIFSEFASEVKYFGSGCPLENISIEKLYPQIKFSYFPSAFSYDPMANPIVLKSSSLLSLGLIGLFRLRRTLEQIEDCDAIYFSYPSLLSLRIIPRAVKMGKKVILANHGTFFEYFGHNRNPVYAGLRNLGERVLLKPLTKYKDNLIVHTQTSFQTDVYRGVGLRDENIIEVPQNNVDFSEYRVGKPTGQFKVTFLGRLASSKGVELLVRVVSSNPQIKFNIIGNGPLMKKLMKSLRKSSAEIFGYTDSEEKKRILEESDLMIVPSKFDSLSIAAIEGLAAGLPLIVTNSAEGPKYIVSKDSLFGEIVDREVTSISNHLKKYQDQRNDNPGTYYKDKLVRKEKASKIFNVKSIINSIEKQIIPVLFTSEETSNDSGIMNDPPRTR